MPTVPTTGATVQPEPADLTGNPVSRDPLTIDIPPIPPDPGDAPTPDDLEQFGDDDFEALNEQKIEAAGLLNAMPDDDGTTLDFPPTNDTPSFDHSFALIDPDEYDSVDNEGITRLTNINNYHSPGQNSIREIENEVRTASIQAGLPYQFTQEDRGVNYTIERRPGVGDFITARNGVKEAAPIGLDGFLNEETGEILPTTASEFDAELRKIIEDPTHPEMSDFLLAPTGGAGQGLTEEEKAGLKDFIERLPATIGDLPDAFIRGGLKTLVEAFAASPLAQFVDPASIQKARGAIKASSEGAAAEGVLPTGVETLSSFIVAFNPIVRALRLAGVVGPLSTIVAFGLVKAVADNPDDPNLANLIVQMMGEEEPDEEGVARPLGGAEIAQAIAAFLSTEIGSPEETRAERSLREMLNRIRNFAVGSLEGVAIETVLAPLRILKRSTPEELEVHTANVDKTIDELRAARAARQRPEETSELLASGEAAFQQDVGTVSRTLGIPPEEAERLLQAAAERGVGMEGAIIEGGGKIFVASKTPTAVSRPPSPVETPAPKNQEEIARVRDTALKAVNRTTGRLVKNTAVVNGLASHLRTSAATAPKSVERIPKADLVPQTKAPANREKVYENMDRVKGNHPDAMTSPIAYAAMQAEAFGIRDVPVAPERLIHIVNNPATSVKELRLLSNKQRSDAADGLALAAKARKLIEDGKWPVVTTVQNFLWGSLSKGVTPFVQESSFLDVARKATPLFNRAIKGNFTEADLSKWEKLGDLIFTKGSGRPGEGARANFNAFGKQFLLKLSKKDKDGVTIIQKIHDLFTDLNKTGPQVRREILALAPGSGFDGKVLSFNLLGSGRTDVMVVDRVMFENLYNHKNKFDGINLYDGFKEKRMVRNKKTGKLGEKMATVNGSEGASIFFGPRGLLHYEVMEEGLAKVVPDIYRKLGRPDDGTLGNWHWENWVLKSGQSVGHPTLDTLVKSAEGDPAAFRDMTIENGKFDTYGSGGRWTIDGSGRGVYTYKTADGTPYKFSPMRFKELQKEFKNPKNGVVPKGFKVSDHTKEPWFESKEVDLGKRDEIVRRLGRPVGGDGGGDEPLPGGPIGPRGGGGEAGPESGKVRVKSLVAEGREPPTIVGGKALDDLLDSDDPLLETPEPEPELDLPPPPGDSFVSIEELYRKARGRARGPEPELDLDLPPRPPEVPPRNRRASDDLEVVEVKSNTPSGVSLTPGLQAYMDDNKRILGSIMNRSDFDNVDLNIESRLKAQFKELEGQRIELPDKIGGMRLKPLVTLGDEALTIPIIQSLGRVLADRVHVPPVGVLPDTTLGSVGVIAERFRGGIGMDLQFSSTLTSDQFLTTVPHEIGHVLTFRVEKFRRLLLQETKSDLDLEIMAGVGIVPIEEAEVMARDLNFERFTAAFQGLFGDSRKEAENKAGIILNELEGMSRMRRSESWDSLDEAMDELAKAVNFRADINGAVTSNFVYLMSTSELTGDGMAFLMERPDYAREHAPQWTAFVKKLVNEDPLISRILYILGLSSIMLPGVPELLEEIDPKTLEGDDGGST